MKMKMRPRYYCDHCKKANGSPSAMKRHEVGCTANPQRVCGMCRFAEQEGGPEPAPNRDELVRVMDTEGFAAMVKVANGCPACILSALRTKNVSPDGLGPSVGGPEDGRHVWDYQKAKADWWSDYNSERSEWAS